MKKVAVLGSISHQCKRSTGNTPHVGGPAIQTSNALVFVNGQPILLKGDQLLCNAPDMPIITEGSSLLFINGQPVALEGHCTSHDSKLQGGSGLLSVES